MTKSEFRRIQIWFDNHQTITVLMFFIAVGFAVIIPLVANNRIPQACPNGDGFGCYKYNGFFDWGYLFKWYAIGVVAIFIPAMIYGINSLIVRGRHQVGLTPESRHERERKRELREREQAQALVRAEARVRELEATCELQPLDPFTRHMVQ